MRVLSKSLVIVGLFLSSCSQAQEPSSQPLKSSKASTDVDYFGSSVEIDGPTSPEQLIFRSYAYDLDSNNKLSGGKVVEVPDWPGVLNTLTCTAALIGPDTVLTAAHCVDARTANSPQDPKGRYKTIPAKLDWFDREIDLECEMSDAYTAVDGGPSLRNIHDQALCFIKGASPTIGESGGLITGKTLYERIDVSGRLTTPNSKITMAGFGCYDHQPYKVESRANPGSYLYWISFACDHKSDGPFIRRLRVGHDRINKYDMVLDGDYTAEVFDANVKIINYSKGKSGEPALCPGDSGGPLFSGHQKMSPGDEGSRRVIGVNSTVSLSSLYPTQERIDPTDYAYISNMASLSNPEFISFLERWTLKYKTKVCIDGYKGKKDIISSVNLCRK